MNTVSSQEQDSLIQTHLPLLKGLQQLTNLLPNYKKVADPLSYITACQIVEELRLESWALPDNELSVYTERVVRLNQALRQAIADWLTERNY